MYDEPYKPLSTTDHKNLATVEEGKRSQNEDDESNVDEEDDEEEDVLGFYNALFWLAAITVLIAILSEAISETIQNAANDAGISGIFIAAILLPIVGNAAEHAGNGFVLFLISITTFLGAVMFAWKGKVDLALGVAIGSSTQIAVCVLPFLVLLGWMMGKDLDLNFGAYESACVLLTVISVTFAIKDGESNWLVGATLIWAYLIISMGFWVHSNDSLSSLD